ncbi:hypothetical protein [Spirosoma sp.]|uniref:hypothetical protein n=1 Tax=Spirosoma sp. TaxID=1899569 RepID=UPI00260391C6|nr:hypothetical protein [Spirosoma sp.]MCX6217650.1 hypothetical protein [Spirosoma sp.]
MKIEKFDIYEAVHGISDVRYIVAIMFGTTDRAFIKRVLNLSGYPFGSETCFASQLREIHGEWLSRGKTLEGLRSYGGMVDPFDKLEDQLQVEQLQRDKQEAKTNK